MQNYPWTQIERRSTRQIRIGSVRVGGDAPISVQSMTNTPTEDVDASVDQIERIAEAGADIVRVSCPVPASTRALERIVVRSSIPVVADIHFHYERGLEAIKSGASCLRINPGNIGGPDRVSRLVEVAREHGCPIRIGVNAGSLERHLLDKHGGPGPQAMVESAMGHAGLLEERGFYDYKISVKASDVFLTMAAYEALSRVTDAPLHLGVTEAGSARIGSIKSAIALGWLLRSGIGDTLRVSLSSDPVEEVRAGFDILKSLNLRHRGVTIIACPSCARQGFDVIETVRVLEERLAHVREPVVLSVIGCVVNGPGEAAGSDIGFTGGGNGAGMLYVSGAISGKLSNEDMIDRLVAQVEQRAARMRMELGDTA